MPVNILKNNILTAPASQSTLGGHEAAHTLSAEKLPII
jgi:hypothetical protein